MKTILILALLGVLVTAIGCEQPKPSEEDTELENTVVNMIDDVIIGDVEVIIIENCEYLIYKKAKGNNQGYGFMSHKGNCKNPIHLYSTPTSVDQR